MEPESTKNEAKIEKNALKSLKWLPDGSQDLFSQNHSQIFTNFWVPSRTPKSTKNQSLATKGAPGSDFLLIFLAESVFFTFGLKLSPIFGENRRKTRCIFLHPPVFFVKLATLTKHFFIF